MDTSTIKFNTYSGEALRNLENTSGLYNPENIAKKIFDVVATVNGNYKEEDYRSYNLDRLKINVSVDPIKSWRGNDEVHDTYYTMIVILEIDSVLKKPQPKDFEGVYLINQMTTHQFGIAETFAGYELTKIW